MSNPTPEELRAAVSEKEVGRLRRGLELMARRKLGNDPEIPDLIQDIVTRVLQALDRGQIDSVTSLGGFAAGVARHVFADHLRRTIRERSRDTVDADIIPDQKAGALSELVTTEERARLRSALERLDPKDQNLLRLSFYEELTPAKIAAQTGEPPERIRKRKSRALNRLRNSFLGSHETGPDTTTWSRSFSDD